MLLPCANCTPLPLNLVLPPIFDYQLKHNFVLVRTLFAQALAIVPHWFLGRFFGMVYEHLSRCFIPKDPSTRFSKLFQAIVVVTHGDILRSVALVLWASRLLAMIKDVGGFRLIVVVEMFI